MNFYAESQSQQTDRSLVCTEIKIGNFEPTDVSELGRCVTFEIQSFNAPECKIEGNSPHTVIESSFQLHKNNQHIGLRFKRDRLDYSSNS